MKETWFMVLSLIALFVVTTLIYGFIWTCVPFGTVILVFGLLVVNVLTESNTTYPEIGVAFYGGVVVGGMTFIVLTHTVFDALVWYYQINYTVTILMILYGLTEATRSTIHLFCGDTALCHEE